MDILIKVLLAYSCGFMDRIRGDRVDLPYSKTVEAYIYGVVVFCILGFNWWQCLIGGVCWAGGASFGWGEPLGAALRKRPMNQDRLESWQVGPLKTNIWLALTARGLIWGICLLPFVYFDPKTSVLMALSMGAIFPFAVYLATVRCPKYLSDWETQEVYRGWLSGLAALVIYYLK